MRGPVFWRLKRTKVSPRADLLGRLEPDREKDNAFGAARDRIDRDVVKFRGSEWRRRRMKELRLLSPQVWQHACVGRFGAKKSFGGVGAGDTDGCGALRKRRRRFGRCAIEVEAEVVRGEVVRIRWLRRLCHRR